MQSLRRLTLPIPLSANGPIGVASLCVFVVWSGSLCSEYCTIFKAGFCSVLYLSCLLELYPYKKSHTHPGFCWENSVHIDSKMIIALRFVQKDLDAAMFFCFAVKYLPASTSRSQTVDQNIYPIKTLLILEGNFSTSVCQFQRCQNPHWDSSCSRSRLSQRAEKYVECLFLNIFLGQTNTWHIDLRNNNLRGRRVSYTKESVFQVKKLSWVVKLSMSFCCFHYNSSRRLDGCDFLCFF